MHLQGAGFNGEADSLSIENETGDANMNYYTFQILIRAGASGKFVDVVAVSYEAALADLNEAYGNVEVITYKQVR